MTPALPHIPARKALAADLKARRAYREECQAVAAPAWPLGPCRSGPP